MAENIEYYLKERIVERVLAYGEVAALLRGLQAAGVDLKGLARQMRASDTSSTSPRAATTLKRGWLDYLKEIQAENQYANWSGPPYDLYVNRNAAHKPASSTGR